MVRPQSCQVIYYFDTPALGRRHQSFGRVSSKTCMESPHKILARSNDQIKTYDCCRKPGLLRFLRQNLNLTLLGSYHRVEPYQGSSGIMTNAMNR